MGIIMDAAPGIPDPHLRQGIHGAISGFPWGHSPVDPQRLRQLRANAQVGIQRGERILEYKTDFIAAQGSQSRFRLGQQVHAVEPGRAADHPCLGSG